MRAAHFDDSASRGMRGEREQLAAMLAAAAAEIDSTGPEAWQALEPVPPQPEVVTEGPR